MRSLKYLEVDGSISIIVEGLEEKIREVLNIPVREQFTEFLTKNLLNVFVFGGLRQFCPSTFLSTLSK